MAINPLADALFDERPITEPVPGRRVQGGIASSDVVHSAAVAGNAELFPEILGLHVPRGAVVADVTWGKGVFWSRMPPELLDEYHVLISDLDTGVDATALPYGDASLDALVFDPPYMEGLFRAHEGHLAGGGSHAAFREHYSNGKTTVANGDEHRPKYHQAVLDLYRRASVEARRVLRNEGIYIVKCQDEVSANRQELTHVQIIQHLESIDFYCRDLFVLVRRNKAGMSRVKKQVHARKNHSYFLVFQKAAEGRGPKMKSKPLP